MSSQPYCRPATAIFFSQAYMWWVCLQLYFSGSCITVLPRVYKFKQVTMRFKPQTPEERIKFDGAVLGTLNKKDLKRLQVKKSKISLL